MLTEEQKQKILNRNYEWLQPYIMNVFKQIPQLENSATIEGIAMEWAKMAERRASGRATIEEAIKAYEKQYEKDREYILKTTGQTMPDLVIPAVVQEEPKYVVNEELSAATIEALARETNFIKKLTTPDGLDDFLSPDREANRFYGTELNEQSLMRIWKVNSLMDILATAYGVTVEKYDTDKPDPYSREAIFAVESNNLISFTGTAYEAFQKIIDIADDIMFLNPEGKRRLRIVITIKDIWSKWRRMDDDKLKDLGLIDDEEDSFI